ncbi:MAG: hypothetical protein IPO59_22900 [Betaproteobacteria bacterium]|nr:hypothetical protein [Betaproteobacteria bacterium]
MLKLVRLWLQAGVMEDGVVATRRRNAAGWGDLAAAVNIYLRAGPGVGQTRCASGRVGAVRGDFVVLCGNASDCEEAQARIGHVLGRLGLKLHPQKTQRVVLTGGREGFDLGCHLRKRMSGRLWGKAAAPVLPAPLAEPAGDGVRARVRG